MALNPSTTAVLTAAAADADASATRYRRLQADSEQDVQQWRAKAEEAEREAAQIRSTLTEHAPEVTVEQHVAATAPAGVIDVHGGAQ